MTNGHARYVLAIGGILGDADEKSEAWSDAIGELNREVQELGWSDYAGLGVNVVFRVDGDILPLDFSGVRSGSYRKERGVLEVQAAMAKEPVPVSRRAQLLAKVCDAIDEAEAYVVRRKIASELPELRVIEAALLQAKSA